MSMPIFVASIEMFVTVPVSRPHHVPSQSTATFLGLLVDLAAIMVEIELVSGGLGKSYDVSKSVLIASG